MYILFSSILTSMYHYMGLQLAKAVSAGVVLTSTFAAKLAIVVFAAICLGDSTRPICLFALALALVGNLIYMLARLQVMHAQELAEPKMKDTGTDIADNIRAKPDEPERAEPEPRRSIAQEWWDSVSKTAKPASTSA